MYHPLDNSAQVFLAQVRPGADFRETVCDLVQAEEVVFHFCDCLGYLYIRLRAEFHDFHPAHHARQWCPELVGGFARHSDPDIALLAPLDIAETDVSDKDEKCADGNLDIGKPPKPSNKQRLSVMHPAEDDRILVRNDDGVVHLIHAGNERADIRIALAFGKRRIDVDIPRSFYFDVVCIGLDNREIDSADKLVKNKVVFAPGVGAVREIFNGFCVERGDLAFFRLKPVDEIMRVDEDRDDDDESRHQQCGFDVPGFRAARAEIHGRK